MNNEKIKIKRRTRIQKLLTKLKTKYPELTGASHYGKEIKRLSFAEQCKAMYEIENIKTQKITRWVLIILAICNLILVGLQIWL